MRYMLIFPLLLSLVEFANASDSDCELIPKIMGVDKYEYEGAEGLYNYLYSSYCEGQNIKSNLNIDLGVEAVIQYVPLKGNFSFGSAKEKLRHICQTNNNVNSSLKTQEIVDQRVVREALNAYNECLDMRNTRLVLKSTDPSTFSIGLQLRSARVPVSFSGLELGGVGSSTTKCYALPAPDSVEKSILIDRDVRAKLSDSLWTMTCHRQLKKISEGDDGYYPALTVQVNTTDRSLGIALPQSTYFGPESAEDMRRLLQELEARQAAEHKEMRTASTYEVTLSRGNNGYRGWNNGQPAVVIADVCALTKVWGTQWHKSEYEAGQDCEITHDVEKRTWTLKAGGLDSTATRCHMTCLGVDK